MLSATLIPGCCVMPSTAATASGTYGGVADRGEFDNPDAIREGTRRPSGEFKCQPCLSDAADSGEGHQPMLFQHGLQLGQLHIAADKARGWSTKVPGRCVQRSQRWEISDQAVSANLPDVDGFRDVAKSTRTQCDEVESGQQIRCCAVEQDLPAVPGRHHPCRAVEYCAEVVAFAKFGLTGRQAHPHRQFERALCGDRGIDRSTWANANTAQTPSPVCLNNQPSCASIAFAQHLVVGRERRRASRPRRLPNAGSTPRCR